MQRLRSLWFAGFIMLILSPSLVTAAPKWKSGEDEQGPPGKVLTRDRGQVFCPSNTLVYGNVVIPGGRCYLLSVLRNESGTFLAFVPPDTKIPPGQLVRLSTPAGPKVHGHMFLVPIQTNAALVPVNTLTLVTTRIEHIGPQVTIVLVGTADPHAHVLFNEHAEAPNNGDK